MGHYGITALPSLLILAGSGSVILGILFWKIKRFLGRYQRDRIPNLLFTKAVVSHPAADSKRGAMTMVLRNERGGELQLLAVRLLVLEHGPSLNLGSRKPVRLPKHPSNEIALSSTQMHYPLSLPHTRLSRHRETSLKLTLHSNEQHWFRMTIEAEWSAGRSATGSRISRSAPFYMEFPLA
ncbi:hypothetical protein [Teredinibacter turnerae]|uniref:hypothetical protein n=1 Tax=Teredinibacter turnerae TaxID=2426 RepID=UPI0005F7A0DD|nr:hypothetical protein [Teredinibacter turnerae]